ncbi:MAG: nitrate reductase molybdenum cofactor assembly chaperone [Pseudomonadota bacterium]
MNRTLKILSLLLTYPTQELKEAARNFPEMLEEEGHLDPRRLRSLGRLISELSRRDLYDSQERYVLLFDRSRTLSLNLFEHIHGESRDRGQAMVDLRALYTQHGLDLSARELPDFLPLFLEFLSTRPGNEAGELLADTIHIITAIKQRLRKRQSSYAAVFWALEALSLAAADKADVRAILQEPDDDPNDFEALDKVWEEEAVTFGPGPSAAACGPDRIAAQLRADLRRPPAAGT